MGQVTPSGSDPPHIFPILLFPMFLFPQEQDIHTYPGVVQKQRCPTFPWGVTQPLRCLGNGDSTAEPHSSPEAQPCSPGPCKSLKRVGIKIQWDFPGASQLAPSCPKKASSKGSCRSFWGKAHPKSLCPLHHVPEELCDPFRSCRDRSAPSQLLLPHGSLLARKRLILLGKPPASASGCTGRRRRGCGEEGNQASRACKGGGGGDVCSLGATSIPVAVRTSLWKRSVTFTWEKLGDFISGFW